VELSYAFDINGLRRPLFFVRDSSILILRRDSTLCMQENRTPGRQIGRLNLPDFDYLISQCSDPVLFGSETRILVYGNPFTLHVYETGRAVALYNQDLWPLLDRILPGEDGIYKIRAEAEKMGVSMFRKGRSLFSIIFANDGIHVFRLSARGMLTER
jgi:hypothetical protein